MKKKINRLGELYSQQILSGKISPYMLVDEFHPFMLCGGFTNTFIKIDCCETPERLGWIKFTVHKKQAKKLRWFQNHQQYFLWAKPVFNKNDEFIGQTIYISGEVIYWNNHRFACKELRLYHLFTDVKRFIPDLITTLEINLLGGL
jgi:hypothetical protein